MTIDPNSGRIAFPEIGLTVDPVLTRTEFARLPTGATCLGRVRHDPTFRYQLPAVPQPDSELYAVLQFHDERLASVSLLHHAERFGSSWSDWSEPCELARKNFHEQWLASQFGITCRRYRWGEVSSNYDFKGGCSSILIEYAKPNAWQVVGRTAGRLWGAASAKP